LREAACAASLLEAHLGYARLGIATLPILKGEKVSGLPGWQHLGHPDEGQIRRWHSNGQYGGVALRPGAFSHNLLILDCDGLAVYQAFCQQFPDLAETYTELTGSGQGMHLFFQAEHLPSPERTPQLKGRKVARKGILGADDLGFEVFFDSGAVVVAPSSHPSGGQYRVHKNLPVLQVPDIDEVITWAYSLETKAERGRPARHKVEALQPRTRHPSNIPTEVISQIQHSLSIGHYQSNGWSSPLPCLFAQHEHDDEKPAAAWHRDKHIFRCFKCNDIWLAKAVAERLNIAWPERRAQKAAIPPAERIKAVPLPKLNADLTVNLRYISTLAPSVVLQRPAALIKSPVGTGKTELIKQVIAAQQEQLGHTPSVLVITHRQALAHDISERLELECYKGFSTSQLRQINHLVICVNSLVKLDEAGKALPSYDLIFLDEIEQFLAHFDSETFRGNTAKAAYQVLQCLIKRTAAQGHVIGLDADAGVIAQTWLASLVTPPNLLTIENTYQPERGLLTLHQHAEAVVARAFSLIEIGQTPVVIPTNSLSEAKRIHALALDRLGTEGVHLICSENSESSEAQQFIGKINEELPKAKLLIYTPSLGTGVDITAPVKAVCAVFHSRPLAAPDLLQMLGRCRHAAETHVYVQPSEGGTATTNAEAIYDQHIKRVQRTRQECAFDEHGVFDANPLQKSILRLLSQIEAEHNRNTNNLLSYFVALAERSGYRLEYVSGRDHTMRAALKEARKAIAERDKAEILAAAPVSHDDLELHRARGNITPEIRAGYERFKIEDTVGQPLNEPLYDDLHKPQARDALRRFTDLLDTPEEMQARDRQQARDEHLISKRKHYTIRRALISSAIRAAFGDAGLKSREELTTEVINERLSDFVTLHRQDLHLYFGRRNDQTTEPIFVLRWLLKRIGLKLIPRQVMVDRKRFYVYRLDSDAVAKQQAYSDSRLRHLAQKKSEKAPSPSDYLKNTYKDIRRYRERSDIRALVTAQMISEGWRKLENLPDVVQQEPEREKI
jgi:late competence protein required for DNA uptake (superfamily II DNA/RNA helicase)